MTHVAFAGLEAASGIRPTHVSVPGCRRRESRGFSILTKQQVRRGVYHDVPELIAAIDHFIAAYNERAQPFVWTKTGEQVLAKAIKRSTYFRNAALGPQAWLGPKVGPRTGTGATAVG